MQRLEDFIRMIESEFERPAGSLSGDDRLLEDLMFDSLEVLRLGVLVDRLAPIELWTEDLNLTQVSLRDIWDKVQIVRLTAPLEADGIG